MHLNEPTKHFLFFMFFSITITTSDALVGWSDERELLGFISTVEMSHWRGP